MFTYIDPTPIDFSCGPELVIPYEQVLKTTMVHGYGQAGTRMVIIRKIEGAEHTHHAIAAPTGYLDDVSTIEGKVIHFNRVRLISASIKFHHEEDGSFSLASQEKVKWDMKLILSWPPALVLSVVCPGEFSHEILDYPPLLESNWIGKYPDEGHISIEEQLERRDIFIPDRNWSKETMDGPPTYAAYLRHNKNMRLAILQHVRNHREWHLSNGGNNFDAIVWCDIAIRSWNEHNDYISKYVCDNYVVGEEVDSSYGI